MIFREDHSLESWCRISQCDVVTTVCRCGSVLNIDIPVETKESRGFYKKCLCGKEFLTGVPKDVNLRDGFKTILVES